MRSLNFYFLHSVFIYSLSALLPGCLALPQIETPIHQSSEGQIMLKTFPQPTDESSHPTDISPTLMRKVLQGLRVQEDKGLLDSLLVGENQALPVFNKQEVEFLTPHLQNALAQSTPEEYVFFQVTHHKTPIPTMTSGSLYRSHNHLQLGLQQFKTNKRRTTLSSKASVSPARIQRWLLLFSPEDATFQDSDATKTNPIFSKIGNITIDINALFNMSHSQKSRQKKQVSPQPRPHNQDRENIQGLEREIGDLQEQLEKQNRKLRQLEERLE